MKTALISFLLTLSANTALAKKVTQTCEAIDKTAFLQSIEITYDIKVIDQGRMGKTHQLTSELITVKTKFKDNDDNSLIAEKPYLKLENAKDDSGPYTIGFDISTDFGYMHLRIVSDSERNRDVALSEYTTDAFNGADFYICTKRPFGDQ